MPVENFQASRDINRKMPFGIKMLKHKLNKPNIQKESINDYYGENILIMLARDTEMPDCKPLKTIKYNGGITLARFCEF